MGVDRIRQRGRQRRGGRRLRRWPWAPRRLPTSARHRPASVQVGDALGGGVLSSDCRAHWSRLSLSFVRTRGLVRRGGGGAGGGGGWTEVCGMSHALWNSTREDGRCTAAGNTSITCARKGGSFEVLTSARRAPRGRAAPFAASCASAALPITHGGSGAAGAGGGGGGGCRRGRACRVADAELDLQQRRLSYFTNSVRAPASSPPWGPQRGGAPRAEGGAGGGPCALPRASEGT